MTKTKGISDAITENDVKACQKWQVLSNSLATMKIPSGTSSMGSYNDAQKFSFHKQLNFSSFIVSEHLFANRIAPLCSLMFMWHKI